MECLKVKKDTFEQKLNFLLGQSGGFTAAEHKLYSLSVLCLQNSHQDTVKQAHIKNQISDHAKEAKSDNIRCDETIQSNNCLTAHISHAKNDSSLPSCEETNIQSKQCAGKHDPPTGRTLPSENNLKHTAPDTNNSSSSRDHGSEYEAKFTDKDDVIPYIIQHICESQDNNCGCDLFLPKPKLPAVFHQQTYSRWKSMMDIHWRLRMIRKKPMIYIQPLEKFPEFVDSFTYTWRGEQKTGFFVFLKDFLSLFFMGLDVRLMETKLISEYGWKVKERYHHKTNKEQLLVKDIYSNMTSAIPKDGFSMLGITWTDLYPSEELNFVLGEASSYHRAAVFCFGRFEPKAYVGDTPPPPIEDIKGDLIFRMIKLITHETCHIYGLSHCVFFECTMNESHSMQEALHQPLFLCPVCLKKLQKACHFDLLQRYEAMLAFLEEINQQYPSNLITTATTWLQQCLAYLGGRRIKQDTLTSTKL